MASSAKPLPLIRRITLENLPAFKETRLRALAESPSAFGLTYEAESQFSDAQWRARLERWNGERGVGLLAMEGNVAYGIAGALVDDDDDGASDVTVSPGNGMGPSHSIGRPYISASSERLTSIDKYSGLTCSRSRILLAHCRRSLRVAFAATAKSSFSLNNGSRSSLKPC